MTMGYPIEQRLELVYTSLLYKYITYLMFIYIVIISKLNRVLLTNMIHQLWLDNMLGHRQTLA